MGKVVLLFDIIIILIRLLPAALSLRTVAAWSRPLSVTRFMSTAATKSCQRAAKNDLWSDWVQHSSVSYHHFSPQDAKEIRSALLVWYRQNRRKLPWRGDALGECNGSTAGINKVNAKNKKGTDKQESITNFFPIQTTAKEKTKQPKEETKPVLQDAVIPMSGYGVWVSEIMCQQTRVEAVIPYWIKWMTSFPTVHDLAAATEEQVNSHWAGLGFYRRARFLHQGAKHVVKELNGEIPQEVDSLMKLPGIGRYTASAIASITFDKPVAVVDGNVCRVLSRLTGIANHIKAPILKDKLGWDLANQLVLADDDGKYAGEVNQALMELGATYCAPSGTGVDPRDPLKDYYKSTKLGRAFLDATETVVPSSGCEICDMAGVKTAMEKFQAGIEQDTTTEDAAKCGHATFPLDPPKKKKREEDLAIAAVSNVYNNETWWLLVKRPPQGLLAGQWEFPNVCVQTRNAKSKEPTSTKLDAALTRYLQEDLEQKWIAELDRTSVQPAPMEHIFSHVKHIMWIASCISRVELDQLEWITARDKEVRWMREKDMTEVGITSGVKKILKAVKGHSKTKSQRKRKR